MQWNNSTRGIMDEGTCESTTEDCHAREVCYLNNQQMQCLCNRSMLYYGEDCEETNFVAYLTSIFTLGVAILLLGEALNILEARLEMNDSSRQRGAGTPGSVAEPTCFNIFRADASTTTLMFSTLALSGYVFLGVVTLLRVLGIEGERILYIYFRPASVALPGTFSVLCALNSSYYLIELTQEGMLKPPNVQATKKIVKGISLAYFLITLVVTAITSSIRVFGYITVFFELYCMGAFLYGRVKLDGFFRRICPTAPKPIPTAARQLTGRTPTLDKDLDIVDESLPQQEGGLRGVESKEEEEAGVAPPPAWQSFREKTAEIRHFALSQAVCLGLNIFAMLIFAVADQSPSITGGWIAHFAAMIAVLFGMAGLRLVNNFVIRKKLNKQVPVGYGFDVNNVVARYLMSSSWRRESSHRFLRGKKAFVEAQRRNKMKKKRRKVLAADEEKEKEGTPNSMGGNGRPSYIMSREIRFSTRVKYPTEIHPA
mmetsp:Transcript_16841/g.29734  ORF Transcript_16841/g.29734 Transcript_16841/m.29734 type:complete len:484 (+) Transcript_16841:97-1548(+)